jgi:hypothetical protein
MNQVRCGGFNVGQVNFERDCGGKTVGPARKREAVKRVQLHLKTSERLACAGLRQSQITQRNQGCLQAADTKLVVAKHFAA